MADGNCFRFFFTIDADYLRGSDTGLAALYDFCLKYSLKPTIFVTGKFAVEYPALLQEGIAHGYELGTHGWAHGEDPDENFDSTPYEYQRERIRLATEAVEAVSGKKPVAFRAPNLWISETLLRALEDEGYQLDSSVPARRFDMGYGQVSSFRYFSAPLEPYHPSHNDMGKRGSSKILEVAPSAFWIPLNMSGLRVLGLSALKWAVRRVKERSRTLVFYVHPGEFVPYEQLDYVLPVPRRYRRGLGPQNLSILGEFVEYVLSLGYEPDLITSMLNEDSSNNKS